MHIGRTLLASAKPFLLTCCSLIPSLDFIPCPLDKDCPIAEGQCRKWGQCLVCPPTAAAASSEPYLPAPARPAASPAALLSPPAPAQPLSLLWSPLQLWPPCSLSTALTALSKICFHRGATNSPSWLRATAASPEGLASSCPAATAELLGPAGTSWNWYGAAPASTYRGRPAAPPHPGERPPPRPRTPPAEACGPQGRGAAAEGPSPEPLATGHAALSLPAEPGVPAGSCQPPQTHSPPSPSGLCNPQPPAAACVGDSGMDFRSGPLGHWSLLL